VSLTGRRRDDPFPSFSVSKLAVIAGNEADLLQLTREHVPLLCAQGLATDHPVTVCQAKDGTVVEVFEWEAGGAERAHVNPVAMTLWERYSVACDDVPLLSLAESSTQFASLLLSHSRQTAFAGLHGQRSSVAAS
jgi:hypothetical protein